MSLFEKAAERLARGGLYKGQLGGYHNDTAPVCVIGSIWAVTRGDGHPEFRDRWLALDMLTWVAQAEGWEDADDWNDDPSTTVEDMLLLLKKADALAQELGLEL